MRPRPLLVLLALFLAGAAPAAERVVEFEAVETYPGASATPPGTVRGWLSVPAGEGPFAALVLLHGCAGPGQTHAEWARELTAWGYVTLRVDSFGPRGIEEICTDIRRYVPREADVNGALAFLAAAPEVDPERLGVIGWSHGASVALRAAGDPGPLLPAHRRRLRAAVAFYPYCLQSPPRWLAPVLVLIGAADDWTPATLCEQMVERSRAAGDAVELAVYPGATHSFDCRACDGRYWGHRLVHDPAAHRDARERLRRFLDRALAP